MKICFIGAGKVGTTLGLYFKNYGFNITGYYSRTYESALKASNTTKTKAYSDLNELIDNNNFIFITTNDDSIVKVSKELSNMRNSWENYIIAHTSGALTSETLIEFANKGAGTYSIHPLQTFADPELTCSKLENTIFTIEGNNNLHLIEDILRKTNNKYTIIDKSKKALYHAGACVASNYLVTLLDISYSLIKQSGFNEEDIYDGLEPLILGTLNNIKNLGINNALTGPIARGDKDTISNHVDKINDERILDFYKYVGLYTLGLTSKDVLHKEIEKILRGEMKYE